MKNGIFCILVALLGFAASTAPAASTFAPRNFTPMGVLVIGEGPAAEGIAAPPGYAWYKFANHTHTTYSDGYLTVEERIQAAAADGADSISIQDHRTQAACSDPGFVSVGNCVPMCAEEWGSDGHLGMLNMELGDPMVGWPVEQAITGGLSRGATIIVNHPRNSGGDPWPYDDVQLGIHGVEVWSTLTYFFSGSEASKAWWDELLAKGRTLFGIGGSDMHMSGNNLSPCDYVLAASPQPDDLQQGIEAGNITISADKDSARCFVWCDANDDGVFETTMGGVVTVPASRTLVLRIEVYSGLGRTLKVVTKSGIVTTLTVGEGNPWRVDLEALVSPNTKDYMRAEIPDPADLLNPMDCITNPIYFNYTPDDADSDNLGDAIEQQIGTDLYAADTDEDGVSDEFEVAYDGNSSDYNPYHPVNNPAGTDLDANAKDSDGDGVKDGEELTYGTDPLDTASVPDLPIAKGSVLVLLIACLAVGALLRPSHSRGNA